MYGTQLTLSYTDLIVLGCTSSYFKLLPTLPLLTIRKPKKTILGQLIVVGLGWDRVLFLHPSWYCAKLWIFDEQC